jgi:hypothetical protein
MVKFKFFIILIVKMSISYTVDGKVKKLELNIFTTEAFLAAVQQSGLESYQNEVAQMKKILSDLPTETLSEIFANYGKAVDELDLELFGEERKRVGTYLDGSPIYENVPKPLRGALQYNYGSDLHFSQELVDLYVRSYRRWMLLAAKEKVLSELLRERMGKNEYIKKFGKIEEKARELRNKLDWIILGFGSE